MKSIHLSNLKEHLAEIYHTGSTRIPMWRLLHWFEKDGGRLTKAFFRDEIFSRWEDYWGEETTPPELSVLAVRADYGVSKPAAFIVFRTDFLFVDDTSGS